MIVAERKPFEELFKMLDPFNKVCLLGCGTCVTVCLAGGEKEVQEFAAALTLYRKKEGRPVEIITKTLERQCEYEFIDKAKEETLGIEDSEVILSFGCGVGVQALSRCFPGKLVFPALNTKFMGIPVQQGLWEEWCLGCGECVLHLTGGICPITRCSKSMLNGPCGGSQDGKCEISKDLDCGWHLIYDRLAALGKLDNMEPIQPPKDWSKSHSGGPGKVVREDVRL